jgi:hypothetical protein
MKLLLPIVLALGVGSTVAAPSGNNGGAPTSAAATYDFSSFCGFPVTATVTGSSKTINLPDGSFILASPDLRVTLTTTTGNSVDLVITGTSTYAPIDNTTYYVTSNGRNLLLVPDANGHPAGLFLTTGTVNYVITTSGQELRTFSGPGKVVDICAALSA